MRLLYETEIKKEYKRKIMYAIFQCDYCNKIIEKPKYLGLRNKSCGCAAKELRLNKITTHGESGNKHRLYRIWRGMKARCSCPKKSEEKSYKNKGIRVCKEWENNYIAFKNWALSNGYKDNLTIDRINNNGNYEPNNCRWITQAEQQRNKTNNILNWNAVKLIRILYKDGITLKELHKIFNISKRNLYRIINNRRCKEVISYGCN